MKKIRIAIVGYGNIGRGVLQAINKNSDMELAGIISRSLERVKKEVDDSIKVMPLDPIDDWIKTLAPDVAILCGGSKKDLPEQGPKIVNKIATVDSFDNHSEVPQYFSAIDKAAKQGNNPGLISIGWDPGIFSLERVLANTFLPGTHSYGFYGLSETGGLSMGHSDALRMIDGVADARQYTHAITDSLERVRRGEEPELTPGEMHTRECFVVLESGAEPDKIEKQIKTMPGYFANYQTTVNFVSEKELTEHHSGFPHDGCVVASSSTGNENNNPACIEYRCAWGSNPEATGSVLVAHARAAYRLKKEGKSGAFTILDFPLSYLSPHPKDDLLKNWI